MSGSVDNDPWNWNRNDDERQKSNTEDNNWISECHVTISPTGELVVIANKRRMVILICEYLKKCILAVTVYLS